MKIESNKSFILMFRKLRSFLLIYKKLLIILFVVIALPLSLHHSFNLRSVGYDQVPETYVIMDERTDIWAGLSIRQTGIPAAWSILKTYNKGSIGGVRDFNLTYKDQPVTWQNFNSFPKPVTGVFQEDIGRGMTYIPIVQPWLDHPPFGALVLSSLVPSSVHTFADLTPAQFRETSLWLAVATGLMIFLLGFQVFKNPFIGLLAAAIYGSAPTFMLMSRYALMENVLTPLFLLVTNILVFAENQVKSRLEIQDSTKIRLLLFLAGVLTGLAALTKITGWSVLLLGCILLFIRKFNFKNLLIFAVPAVIIGSLYFVEGLYLAPNVFINMFKYQSVDRGFIGSINFLVTMIQIGILNFPIDGWWTGGFIALILLPQKKEYLPIFVGALVMLLTALLLGGANYPWYFIPMIPFMVLATAYLIWGVAVNPSFLKILVFFLFFVSSSFYWGYGVFRAVSASYNYQQPFMFYRLMLLFFLGSGLLWLLRPKVKYLKYLWFAVILIMVYQILKWNDQSLLFIIAHWGNLPSMYTPGTF